MSDTDSHRARKTAIAVPSDRPLNEATVDLVRLLGDHDPHRREDLGVAVLLAWIDQGVYDHLLSGLGDGIVTGLHVGLGQRDDPSVIRRATSALVLGEVVSRDNLVESLDRESLLNWGDAVSDWFIRERDHRAWLGSLGWAQALAHGADLIGAIGSSRHLGEAELTVLLDVIGDRLVEPTTNAWRHGEVDRFAHAAMTLLHRNLLDRNLVESWIERVGAAALAPRTRGRADAEWPTPTATNASNFLRALQLQLAFGIRSRRDNPRSANLFASPPRDRADLLLALNDAIRAESPWLFRHSAVRTTRES